MTSHESTARDESEVESKWGARFEKLAQAVYKEIDSCMKDGTHDDCACLFSAVDWLIKEMKFVREKYKETLKKELAQAHEAGRREGMEEAAKIAEAADEAGYLHRGNDNIACEIRKAKGHEEA